MMETVRGGYLYYVKYLPTLNGSITTQLEPRIHSRMLLSGHSGVYYWVAVECLSFKAHFTQHFALVDF